MTGWALERNKGLLSPDTQKLLRTLMAYIEDAIVIGLVVFAGGALITITASARAEKG